MLKRRTAMIVRQSSFARTGVIALAATFVVGLLAAGCGSAGKSGAVAKTPELSKAQFLAQGNAICAQGSPKLAAAEKALGSNPSRSQITTFVASTLAPDIQSQIDGIRALVARSTEQATVTRMLDVAQADLNKVKNDPARLQSGPPFADFAALVHPYGLTACATGN